MRSKKGAMAIFTLLAMMFFLIFIMVAYNNVSSKSKTQAATDTVLLKTYNSSINSSSYYNSTMDGDIKKSDNNTYLSKLKSTKERETIESTTIENGVNKYIVLNGNVYRITN